MTSWTLIYTLNYHCTVQSINAVIMLPKMPAVSDIEVTVLGDKIKILPLRR